MTQPRPAPTSHSLLPAIAERWSPRAYADTAVSDEALLAVLEAGRWASSCFNDQPWVFIVARHGTAEHAAMLATLMPFNQAWAAAAPVLLYSIARENFAHNGEANKHAWHDVGAATANMAIEASARGMQMHGMAGFDGAAARAALAIPAGHAPVTAFTLGFPGPASMLPEKLAEREAAARGRRPAETMLFRGTWNTAL
ncbi:nitroreductase family protein [Rhodovarius sp.]|uniref:nitroreductase family protein n=1 Tax=Rhodovarius sp. TaxID=2972673 RepID=UPI00333FA851